MFLSILTSALELFGQIMKFLTQKQAIDAGKAEADDATRRANEQAIKKANDAREAQRRADADITSPDQLRHDKYERPD